MPILDLRAVRPVYVQPHWFVAIWTIGVGLLMVSRVPTIALKSIRVPPKAFVPLIVILVFALVTFVFLPRVVALIGLALYLAHIPWAAATVPLPVACIRSCGRPEPRPPPDRPSPAAAAGPAARPRAVAGRPAVDGAFRYAERMRVRRRNARRDWDEPRDY